MAVALLVGGWLVVAGPPGRTPSARPPGGALALRQVWPRAAIGDAPGTLPDGAPYTPWLYLDAATSVGVAPTPDGSAQRVVVRTGDAVRELHRVVQDRYPSFAGFTSSGDDV